MKSFKLPWNNLALRTLEQIPKQIPTYEDLKPIEEHFKLSGLVVNTDLWRNQYYIGRDYLQIIINDSKTKRTSKVIPFKNLK